MAAWLAPDAPALRLVPDLDRIDALADEREALWWRISAADFLTDDEKREAVGYGPRGAGETPGAGMMPGGVKYSPDQPRVPAGSSDGAQWTARAPAHRATALAHRGTAPGRSPVQRNTILSR